MVLVQKWPFFQTFFFGNIGKENVFYDILEQKKPFYAIETRSWKKSKNCYFSKKVKPWFWSKNNHCSKFFFLGNIGKGNVFYDILQRKMSFLGFKNKKLKKSNNWHFSKGVNPWFWSKNNHYSNVFF